MYLLDTNVVSETVRRRPDPSVVKWFESVEGESLHLSVLTIGEIRRGVELLGDGGKRERHRVWLEQEIPEWFGARVLDVSHGVAEMWGRLRAASIRTPPAVDSLIAATAIHHGLRMVTRNERDFARFPGLVVVNPWRS